MLATFNQGAAFLRLPTSAIKEIEMAKNTPPKDDKQPEQPSGLSSQILTPPGNTPHAEQSALQQQGPEGSNGTDKQKASEDKPATGNPPADDPKADGKSDSGKNEPKVKQGVIRPDEMRRNERVRIQGLTGSYLDATFGDDNIAQVSERTYHQLVDEFGKDKVELVDKSE